MSCVCPAAQQTRKVVSISSGKRYGAPEVPLRAFRFDAAICDACPLRSSCVRARPGKGRLVMLHPQEALLQEARAFQQSEAFAPYRKLRQAAEHRLARLMQLGVRQARYVGRTKTLCQLLLAATVANLTLVATRVGRMRDRNHIRAYLSHQLLMSTAILDAIRRPFLVQARPELLPIGGFSATPLAELLARPGQGLLRCGHSP